MRNVLQREPMVPLTDATIAYDVAGTVVARDVGTIIVNRQLVDWITATDEEAVVFPEATVRSPFSMNLRKDFTGLDPLALDQAAVRAGAQVLAGTLGRGRARSAPRRARPARRRCARPRSCRSPGRA